jgi:hypothetical protein
LENKRSFFLTKIGFLQTNDFFAQLKGGRNVLKPGGNPTEFVMD